MNAYAVATVLDLQSEPDTRETWSRVEQAFQQAELVLPTTLHFSWHVAESYLLNRVEEFLENTCKDLAPIQTVSTGFGVFTSKLPVFYFPISKTRSMAELHETLWNGLGAAAMNINPLYAPDRWIPHITLAYEDAEPEKISLVSSLLIRESMVLHFRIDHLVLIYRNGYDHGIVRKTPFGRNS